MACKRKNLFNAMEHWTIILFGILMTGATVRSQRKKTAGPDMAPASPLSEIPQQQSFCGYSTF